MVLPAEHYVNVNDYIIIDTGKTNMREEKKFQLKRMSSEPWFCLQEVA